MRKCHWVSKGSLRNEQVEREGYKATTRGEMCVCVCVCVWFIGAKTDAIRCFKRIGWVAFVVFFVTRSNFSTSREPKVILRDSIHNLKIWYSSTLLTCSAQPPSLLYRGHDRGHYAPGADAYPLLLLNILVVDCARSSIQENKAGF